MNIKQIRKTVTMYQAELYRYARFLGADRDTAEDVLQEAFLAAIRSSKLRRVAEDDAMRRWLRGIVRNTFYMHCRRDRTSPVTADPKAMEKAEDTWVRKFLRTGDGFDYLEALRACLGTLDGRMAEAVNLKYREKRPLAELAEKLGMKLSGIKSMMQRIKTALKDCVNRRLQTDEVK